VALCITCASMPRALVATGNPLPGDALTAAPA
jgi:hypothetical protein